VRSLNGQSVQGSNKVTNCDINAKEVEKMAKKVPEFAMMRRTWPPVGPGDPPSEIYHVLKDEQLAKLARLQVKFRQKQLQNQMDFYKELSAFLE